MIHRGMRPGPRRRRSVVAALLVAAVVPLTVPAAERAGGADPSRCERFAADSVARAGEVLGSGPERLVVIGDSYSVGLGLADPSAAWPSRLPGRVSVRGFSGSGFSEGASPCGPVSYADRAAAAVRGGADLVVVEGGLNDHDQPDAAIRAGFARLVDALRGLPVVVVGPVSAPSRAAEVPRVDALLARLAQRHHLPYVRTSGLRLTYLGDRLHLTPEGHRVLGDAVARNVARLSGRPAA